METSNKFDEKAPAALLKIWNSTGNSVGGRSFEFDNFNPETGERTVEKGFMPICHQRDLTACKPAHGECDNCPDKDNLRLSRKMVKSHVEGKARHGVYLPLKTGETTMAVVDIDNHDGKTDPEGEVTKLLAYTAELNLPTLVFSSNSATGYHIYVFIDQPIPAWKARALLKAIVKYVGIAPEIFPKQDDASRIEVGNGIALPYFGEAIRERNSTLLVDPATFKPYGKNALENLRYFKEHYKTMTEAEVDSINERLGVDTPMPKTINQHKAQADWLPRLKEKCSFIKHCIEDSETLKESEWYNMICAVVHLPDSERNIHAMSRNYPKYSAGETDDKIRHARKDCPKPLTCDKIKSDRDCGQTCKVKCPAHHVTSIVNEEPENKKAEAEKLVDIGLRCEFLESEEGDLYARIPVSGHYETCYLGAGSSFQQWLIDCYYREYSKVPNSSAVTSAMNVLIAKARFSKIKKQVHVRMASHGGNIYLDLCNPEWQAIEITPEGWRVIDNPPVCFRRTVVMLPLPIPDMGGSIEALRELIPFVSEVDFVLLVGFLLGTFHPSGPYPILEINGGNGRFKSGISRSLCGIIDPNGAGKSRIPKTMEDFFINASNKWIYTLENISKISNEVSDWLCVLSTGAAMATREKYTNKGEVYFIVKRPAIINGIYKLLFREDLASRTLTVTLSSGERKSEDYLNERYAELHPKILGGLLNLVSAALSRYKTVTLDRLPRLADFATWVEAVAPELGLRKGEFINYMNQNQGQKVTPNLREFPLAVAIIRFLIWTEREIFITTAGEILEGISMYRKQDGKEIPGWPTSPQKLTAELEKLKPELQAIGIEFERSPEKRTKLRRPVEVKIDYNVYEAYHEQELADIFDMRYDDHFRRIAEHEAAREREIQELIDTHYQEDLKEAEEEERKKTALEAEQQFYQDCIKENERKEQEQKEAEEQEILRRRQEQEHQERIENKIRDDVDDEMRRMKKKR